MARRGVRRPAVCARRGLRKAGTAAAVQMSRDSRLCLASAPFPPPCAVLSFPCAPRVCCYRRGLRPPWPGPAATALFGRVRGSGFFSWLWSGRMEHEAVCRCVRLWASARSSAVRRRKSCFWRAVRLRSLAVIGGGAGRRAAGFDSYRAGTLWARHPGGCIFDNRLTGSAASCVGGCPDLPDLLDAAFPLPRIVPAWPVVFLPMSGNVS